jgi:hypothetical protein
MLDRLRSFVLLFPGRRNELWLFASTAKNLKRKLGYSDLQLGSLTPTDGMMEELDRDAGTAAPYTSQ